MRNLSILALMLVSFVACGGEGTGVPTVPTVEIPDASVPTLPSAPSMPSAVDAGASMLKK